MIHKYRKIERLYGVAIILLIATLVMSCSNNKNLESLDLNSIPRQTIVDMFAVQTQDGQLQMRMEAPLMQIFKNDTNSFELFNEGFNVYVYNEEGLLETYIKSDKAKHTTAKKNEKWEAFGNVVITNYIKGEKMETDTLYWDREEKKIFTHCFVKMFSPDGYMQGYGLDSDEMARNAIINRPFDSYGIIKDSTSPVYIDTVNFIGPIYKQ